MAGGLDSFLNFAIPLGIFAFFAFKMYAALQEPIDKFFGWIKSQLFPEEDLEADYIGGMGNYDLQFG